MISDLRLALRSLGKTPGFTAVAVLILALAIAANTAFFSVFSTFFLRPFPFQEPETVIRLRSTNPERKWDSNAFSWPKYRLIRDHGTVFSSTAFSSFAGVNLQNPDGSEQVPGLIVTASFLDLLGFSPVAGRNFTADEEKPNGPRAVLLSHPTWRKRYGGAPDAVGRSVTLNGQPHTIVGVMPPSFDFPFSGVEFVTARPFEAPFLPAASVERGAAYAQITARLKPGVTLAQADAELALLDRRYAKENPAFLDSTMATTARSFAEEVFGERRTPFRVLFAAVAFVLLIAVANAANLFLGRTLARSRETAVRLSLGATRGHILRLFLGESLVLSAAAGLVGLGLGWWTLGVISAALGAGVPRSQEISLDWRVLAYSALAVAVAGLLVGLVPAFQASRVDLVDSLKDSGRGVVGGRTRWFRSSLVVAEVALSVVLLIGSFLLLFSYHKLTTQPPGFVADHVLTANLNVPGGRYDTPDRVAQFRARLLERVSADPRVEAAGTILGLPLGGVSPQAPYIVGGGPIPPMHERPLAGFRPVGGDYFRTMGIPLRAGRLFDSRDRFGAPYAVILNESLARRLFPDRPAVGQTLLRGLNPDQKFEIVGVVADVKTNFLDQASPDEIYYAADQWPQPFMSLVVKSRGDPAALAALARDSLAAVDASVALAQVRPMSDVVAASVANQRVMMLLLASFAGLALVLALTGIYAVLACSVTQRTGEIGVRLALGAQTHDILRLVVVGGAKLVGLGLVIGLALSGVFGRLMDTMLFETKPGDPAVFALVAVVIAGVGLVAMLIPSLRATKVDPLVALRAE